MARTDTLAHYLTDVADAIRAKAGTVGTIQASAFDAAIAAIPTGGGDVGSPGEKDVNFYDYDGTLLYSYTASEFANLTELPADPTHTGLTAQGWNWTLSDAKTFVAANGYLDIGQCYITDDNKTRIYLTVTEETKTLYLGIQPQNSNTTLVVDWGDNTTDTVTISSSYSNADVYKIRHTYTNTGDYIIAFSVDKLCAIAGGRYMNSEGTSHLIFSGTQSGGYSDAFTIKNAYYNSLITKIELGSNIFLGNGALGYTRNLQYMTIPKTMVNSNNKACYSNTFYYSGIKYLVVPKMEDDQYFNNQHAFARAYNIQGVCLPKLDSTIYFTELSYCTFKKLLLTTTHQLEGYMLYAHRTNSLIIPEGTTTIADKACYDNSNHQCLRYLKLPSSISSIGVNAFYGHGLVVLKIPATTNTLSLGNYCFSQSYGDLQVVDCTECTAIPTAGTDIFGSISNSNFKIVVPDALETAWKAASGWSTYSSYICSASSMATT